MRPFREDTAAPLSIRKRTTSRYPNRDATTVLMHNRDPVLKAPPVDVHMRVELIILHPEVENVS